MKLADEIKMIAQDGIDIMVSRVQAHMGASVRDEGGDFAAQHFSNGALRDQIVVALMDYIIAELQFEIDSLEVKYDKA